MITFIAVWRLDPVKGKDGTFQVTSVSLYNRDELCKFSHALTLDFALVPDCFQEDRKAGCLRTLGVHPKCKDKFPRLRYGKAGETAVVQVSLSACPANEFILCYTSNIIILLLPSFSYSSSYGPTLLLYLDSLTFFSF